MGFFDRDYGFVSFGGQPVVFRRRSVKAVEVRSGKLIRMVFFSVK